MSYQSDLEGRYRQLVDRPFDRGRTPREQFGEFESWLLRLGSHELLLNPIDGSWHEYDCQSDTSRPLGYSAGDVSFELDGDLLRIRVVPPSDAPPAAPSARLQVIVGSAHGTERPLDRETSLGADQDNDIVLSPADADPHQAIVRLRGERFVIVDLASKTGTLVNGKRAVAPEVLSAGDVITIGGTQLGFGTYPA